MNKTPSKQLALQPDQSVAAMLGKIIDKGITAENVQALDSLVGLYDRIGFSVSFNSSVADGCRSAESHRFALSGPQHQAKSKQ